MTHETRSDVRLVVADVDGTLLTPDKTLTSRARAAVREVIDAGIVFTITSGRPPLGLKTLIDALRLTCPVVAFNGGLIVRPDLSVIRKQMMTVEVASAIVDVLMRAGLDVWIYTEDEWRVRSRHAPHVDGEERTVGFAPRVVPAFSSELDCVIKVVGVTDDEEAMARCGERVRETFGEQVSSTLSRPYYFDVTDAKANKGEGIGILSELLAIPTEHIAAIGDMPNDVSMFSRSGMSIAMANASADVRRAAQFVTASNTEEGFAQAIERFVLRAPAA